MADADCTCGHPQSRHKSLKLGCRGCDVGCARFEPDEAAQAAETERVLTAVAEVCEDRADRARVELGQQSTSARLREVEAELAAVNAAAGRDIAKPDEPLVDRVADLLRGRTEATERALELAAELSEANGRIRELACEVAQLGDLQDNGDVPPIDGLVLVNFDARHCPPCGWTSSYETHPHPTMPVRVVIHRTEGQA